MDGGFDRLQSFEWNSSLNFALSHRFCSNAHPLWRTTINCWIEQHSNSNIVLSRGKLSGISKLTDNLSGKIVRHGVEQHHRMENRWFFSSLVTAVRNRCNHCVSPSYNIPLFELQISWNLSTALNGKTNLPVELIVQHQSDIITKKNSIEQVNQINYPSKSCGKHSFKVRFIVQCNKFGCIYHTFTPV